MNPASNHERVAILLKSLGDDVADSVLRLVSSERASSVKAALERVESAPPSDDEITDVLEEFNRFIDFAFSTLNSTPEGKLSSESTEAFVSTGDPFEDLEKLHDYQLAGALRHETGATIAVILSQLSDKRVGEVMCLLPDEVKEDAFLRLQSVPPLPRPLLNEIIQSTVDRASPLDSTATSDPDHLADEKTASLLRSMDRNTRTALMATLEKAQPEVAERVKGMLFLFEDVLLFTDKTVQKLLTEVDTAVLSAALKNASEDIIDRIMSNLSKRARASLAEEIEFLSSVSEDEQEAAEKAICEVFSQMDQAGNLEMIA